MKYLKKVLPVFLAILLLCATACGTPPASSPTSPANSPPSGVQDLMAGVLPESIPEIGVPNEPFESELASYSVRLFQQALQTASPEENAVLSPLSVLYALGMAANGADGETRSQMEQILGGGNLSVNSLNIGIHTLMGRLLREGGADVQIGNSIWFDGGETLSVAPEFLQTNAGYYGAQAYRTDFSSPDVVERLNQWVNEQTNGKIDRIADRLDESTMLCLVNTMLFSSEWQSVYREHQVQGGVFHAPDGEVRVKFMHSTEQRIYDDTAQGVVKPFADDRFAFAAILPDDGKIDDYIQSMTGESLRNLLSSAGDEYPDDYARAALPRFRFSFETELSRALREMGLRDAFDAGKADFSRMGAVEGGNLYIGQVLHKSFIEVDELGAKAGAATAVAMEAGGAAPTMKEIRFDRPFVCVIFDTQSKLPLFLGVVNRPDAEPVEVPDEDALEIYKTVFDWLVEQDPALSSGTVAALNSADLEDLSDEGKQAFLQYIRDTRGGTVRDATMEQLKEEGLIDADGNFWDGYYVRISYEKQGDGSVLFDASLYCSPLGAVGANEGKLKRSFGKWTVSNDFPTWIS